MRDALLWSDRLDALVRPVLADCPIGPGASPIEKRGFANAFRDESGVRRSTDQPMIAHLLGIPPDSPANPRSCADERTPAWEALHNPDETALDSYLATTGPLVPALRDQGIEAWTEAELSELHALAAVAIARSDPRTLARCASAVEWHLAELQPDNGTNRPWAVHAFAWFADRLPDALLHARTLVHNACVERGRPERRSALILMHSAKVLRDAASRE